MKFSLLSTYVVLLSSASSAHAWDEEPVPDYVVVPSAECTSCRQTIDDLEMKWTNETTVAEILSDLERQCKTQDSLTKKKFCDAAVQVLVQLPPGIFEGIESLAWPVSLGLCATSGSCQVNCCPAHTPPEQIHLSLGAEDRSVMGVSWTTLQGADSVVRYGTDAGAPLESQMQQSGSVLTYTQGGWVGVVHRAVMTGLKPATTYYYQVGSEQDDRWSEVLRFTTFAPGQELNVAVVADMAYDAMSDDTVAQLTRLVDQGRLDAVIHSGDISYADGYMPHFDDFLNKVQPIASRVPYMTTPGNHEFGYNFSAYKSRFFMPGSEQLGGPEDGSSDGMFYSWGLGDMHFAAMNTESPLDFALFPEQEYAWFAEDLAAHSDAVWRVAHFHRPLYCAKDDDCGQRLLQSGVEELLFAGRVDLAFTAHYHAYERTFPMYHGEKTEAGEYSPVYLMQVLPAAVACSLLLPASTSHSLTHPLTHSPTHYSLTHPLTHSPSHSPSHSPGRQRKPRGQPRRLPAHERAAGLAGGRAQRRGLRRAHAGGGRADAVVELLQLGDRRGSGHCAVLQVSVAPGGSLVHSFIHYCWFVHSFLVHSYS
jgi:acid phosphatase type 7